MEILTDPEQKIKKKKESKNHIEEIISVINSEYDFVYNEVLSQLVWKIKQETEFEYVTDRSMANLHVDLKLRKYKISEAELKRIILSDYVSKTKNDIKDYFKSLKKNDSEEEIKKLCKTLIITGDFSNETFYPLFRRWLLSCYNSAIGIKANEVCLVLTGGQGIGKSTWLDNLTPNAIKKYSYRGQIATGPNSKDFENMLSEKFMINIDDQLSSIFKSDQDAIKTFISQQIVDNRKVYAANRTVRKRIANFCASVNSTNFLTDDENRRFLVVELSDIYQNIIINYDKVWSEVKYIVETGEQTYFNSSEKALQEKVNQSFMDTTLEDELLYKFFRPATKGDQNIEYFMITEIFQIIKELSNEKFMNLKNFQQAIKRQKFNQIKKRQDSGPRKVYAVVRKT